MSTTGEMYGLHYYNKKKPKKYLELQKASKINSLKKQIEELQKELEQILTYQ